MAITLLKMELTSLGKFGVSRADSSITYISVLILKVVGIFGVFTSIVLMVKINFCLEIRVSSLVALFILHLFDLEYFLLSSKL